MGKACNEQQVLWHLQGQLHRWCKSVQLHPVQKATLMYTPSLVREVRLEIKALALSAMHFAVVHNDIIIQQVFILPTMYIILIYYAEL